MTKPIKWFAVTTAILFASLALAQFPVMNMLADKLVQKYQTASCQQLAQEHATKQGQPKPQREQELVTMMRNDPQMRAAFIDKVAAPIANKMFECGMIP